MDDSTPMFGRMTTIVFIVCTTLIVLVAVVGGISHSQHVKEQSSQSMEVCVSFGGQWVEENCVK